MAVGMAGWRLTSRHSSSELSAQCSGFFGALDDQQLLVIEGSCTICP